MARAPTPIHLTPDEEQVIRGWIREGEQSSLKAERARIVLLAAEHWTTQQIARALRARPSRVSKWRKRFAEFGLAGLENAAKPGKPRSYDASTDERILALVAESASGAGVEWSGPALAEAVGVSVHHVWRVLRKRGISLRPPDRRRLETLMLSALRQTAITGLYLAADALVFLIRASSTEAAVPPLLRCHVRLPNQEVAATFRTQNSAHLQLGTAILWAANQLEAGRFTGPGSHSLHDFLCEARRHSGTVDLFAFVSAVRVPVCSGVHVRMIPASSAWKDCFQYWLEVLLDDRPGTIGISALMRDIDRFVSAHRSTRGWPFQWHCWPAAQPKTGSKGGCAPAGNP